jgi:hypothetical protein
MVPLTHVAGRNMLGFLQQECGVVEGVQLCNVHLLLLGTGRVEPLVASTALACETVLDWMTNMSLGTVFDCLSL